MIAGLALAPDDAAGRAALESCLARGNQPPTAFDRAQCDEVVGGHIVDGRYCVGNVLLELDAFGNKVRRCIPQAQIDRKLEIMAKDPLPPRPPPLGSSPSRTTIVVAGLAIGLVAYFALR